MSKYKQITTRQAIDLFMIGLGASVVQFHPEDPDGFDEPSGTGLSLGDINSDGVYAVASDVEKTTKEGDVVYQCQHISGLVYTGKETFKRYLSVMSYDEEITVYSHAQFNELSESDKDELFGGETADWVWQYAINKEDAKRCHVAKHDLHVAMINSGLPESHTL